MKQCKQCGTEIGDNPFNFCRLCGICPAAESIQIKSATPIQIGHAQTLTLMGGSAVTPHELRAKERRPGDGAPAGPCWKCKAETWVIRVAGGWYCQDCIGGEIVRIEAERNELTYSLKLMTEHKNAIGKLFDEVVEDRNQVIRECDELKRIIIRDREAERAQTIADISRSFRWKVTRFVQAVAAHLHTRHHGNAYDVELSEREVRRAMRELVNEDTEQR